MLSIKHILTPVDFSERSHVAALEAVRLAEVFNAELTVLHAQPSAEANAAFGSLSQIEESDKTQLETSRRLEAQLRGFSAKLSPRASSVLAEGDPLTCIKEYVKNHDVGLIVIGTHGRGGFRRFLLGSLTAKLLHDASVPIVTATHLEGVAPFPLKINRIGCALSLRDLEDCERILRWAGGLAQQAGAKLTVIHVPRSVDPGSFSDPETQRSVREFAEKRIHATLEKVEIVADVAIQGGPSLGAIPKILVERNCDALVIGRTGQKGAFEVGHEDGYALIRQSPVPVFSV